MEIRDFPQYFWLVLSWRKKQVFPGDDFIQRAIETSRRGVVVWTRPQVARCRRRLTKENRDTRSAGLQSKLSQKPARARSTMAMREMQTSQAGRTSRRRTAISPSGSWAGRRSRVKPARPKIRGA